MMERLQHMDVAHRRAGRPGINYAQGSWTIVETAVEARAGFRDRPTTVVLIVSTTLTIALFAAAHFGLRVNVVTDAPHPHD